MAKPAFKPQRTMWSKKFTYDYWMESTGVPIQKGFFVEDLRTLELGWWEERQCQSAFIQLMGSEGVSSSRVTEIPAGKTTRPLKFSLDEIVYVVSGRGLTTIWYDNGSAKKSFEWQQHSMFLIPHGCHHQFSNMQGDKPVRLLHYSYLPLALSAVRDPSFLFSNPYDAPEIGDEAAEHARLVHLAQHALRVARVGQEPHEQAVGGRVGAEIIVDEAEIRPYLAQHLG